MKMKTEEQVVMRVSATSIAVNLLLSLFKLLAGIFGHSAAMISDAVHSASDVFSTVIVIAGVKIAGKDADSEHQYGHDRFECVASVVLAIVLGATGLGIGLSGVDKIRSGEYGSFAVPGMMAMIAALVSIAVKEWMFWYTKSAAKKVNCSALMADAWHHRSDAMSSIGSFVGILGARLGFPIFDSLASIVICVLILKAAVEIFLDAMKKMTDESCDKDTVEEMRRFVLEQPGVDGIESLRTRMFGSRIYVDVEICADGNLPLWKAHDIGEEVHQGIEKHFEKVKHCMVHVSPNSEERTDALHIGSSEKTKIFHKRTI